MTRESENRQPCLEQLFNPTQNSLDFIRFFLALLVVFSHSYPLGKFGNEQLLGTAQETYGGFAVQSFFVISGFLITRSWLNKKSIWQFICNRFLRIFPGFWICLLITIFFFAPIVYLSAHGNLNQYFQNQEASPISYFTHNFLLNIGQYNIAGLLKNNPYPNAFNGSLWTLIYEIKCYLMIVFLGCVGLVSRRIVLGLFIFLAFLYTLNIAVPGSAAKIFSPFQDIYLLNLTLYFFSGSVYFLYISKVIINYRILFTCLTIVLCSFLCNSYSFFAPFVVPYIVFWLACKLPLFKFGKYGDFSYGLYIYAFPVQQLLSFYGIHKQGFLIYFLTALFGSLTFAIPSYLWIEKPSMNLRLLISKFHFMNSVDKY